MLFNSCLIFDGVVGSAEYALETEVGKIYYFMQMLFPSLRVLCWMNITHFANKPFNFI